MTKQQIGTLLASLATAALVAPLAQAEEPKKLTHSPNAGAKQLCQNNDCAGKSECMGYGNSACGGGNSCQGKGWVSAKDEAECTSKKGIWHGAKAAAPKPTEKAPSKEPAKATPKKG